jgi:hypothetical protein
MMQFRYDTYCGIYCGACAVINAIKSDKLDDFAKKHNYKPDELECYGCKITQTAATKDRCGFLDCAINKGIEFCFECDEYPCDKLKAFKEDKHPHHSAIFKNSERIKEIGIEPWFSEQENRWKCTACGGPFSWYDEKCEKCGAKLYNCRDEERDL